MKAYLQAYPTATCLNYAFASLTLESLESLIAPIIAIAFLGATAAMPANVSILVIL